MPASPATGSSLDHAVEVLRGRTIAALTGAGISTDSGIPDYRGAGTPVRRPMTIQQFEGDDAAMRRYWAGSHLGWSRFTGVQPNPGHLALADLETAGLLTGVVTQNVDGLHLRAGSRRVVELHGSMDKVRCLNCGQSYARGDIAARLDADNPWLRKPDAVQLRPDGDVEVADAERMVLPVCTVCGGPLKPDVVFFGETVPRARFEAAAALVEAADALLVAGSSLVVNSGIRLVQVAERRELPVVIVNRGETKADQRAAVKVDGGTSETLVALRDRLRAVS